MAIDKKYGNISVPGIPDDEPIFILRAQDKAAPQTINQYAENAIRNGSDSQHAAGARIVSGDFRKWQEDNPDKVKAAD